MRESSRIPVLAVAFTLSGAAALLAEQVFEKLLSTVVGATTPASAIVLSTYFAGLTAGALLYPLFGRWRRATRYLYPLLEVTVALVCLALVVRFDSLVPLFAPWLRPVADRPALLVLMRGVVAAVWILPLTIPMGATFPAIVDAADRIAPHGQARSMSVLYAFNLVGAILAAVGAPLALFPLAGMSGALATAAALDLVAALIALFVLRSATATGAPVLATETSFAPAPPVVRVPRSLLLFAAATGFLLFGLEVTWTHLACAVIGNSVYAFAEVLGSVLLGLGVGSIVSALVFGRRGRVPPWAPGAALVIGALVLAALFPAWPAAPSMVLALGADTLSFGAHELARFTAAAAVIVPPATVLGIAYPLIFRVPRFPDDERGRAAGRIAAVNALGCIAGSLTIGFFLLPRFGSETTMRVLIALSAIVGGASVVHAGAGAARSSLVALVAVALLGAAVVPRWDRLAMTSGAHVYFSRFVPDGARLLSFREDTLGGITTVVGIDQGGQTTHTLLTNGKFQGNDGGEMTAQTSFALVPMQYVKDFDRALVIGLGTGRTAFVVDAMGFRSVDVAEIAPGIVAAARDEFAHVNHHVLDQPNVSLHLEDGRNLLLLHDTTYNLVTIELTSVWFAGVTNLYSREFYQLVRQRLRPGGILQQWIQLHHISVVEVASVIATVRAVFPNVSFEVLGGQGLIIASDSPQEIQPAFVEHLRKSQAAKLLGAPDDSAALAMLVSARLLAPVDVDRLVGFPDVPMNTDGNRFLEYATPRYNFRKDDMLAKNLATLRTFASFPEIPLAPGIDLAAREAIAAGIAQNVFQSSVSGH